MKKALIWIGAILCAALLCAGLCFASSADEETVYLGDRQDLMLPRDYEDAIGWNTAHSKEKLTVWDLSFEKGIGFHCREHALAYIEFDISELDMHYFRATVGVLKDATYYIAEGSIIFRVYGDGKLLYETPVIKWNKKPAYICVDVTGVKTLRLEEDNAGSWVCDAGIWGDAALSKTEPEAPEWYARFDPSNTDKKQEKSMVSGDYAYISDLYFKAFTGEAECRDRNTAGEMIVDHKGRYYPKGIGFHASEGGYNTYLDVDIEGLGFTKFASYYGISLTLTNYDITMANVKFALFADGKMIFESDAVKCGDEMKYIEKDITGVKILRLSVKGNPRIDGAWGTWAGALLSKSGNVTDDMMFTDYFEAITKKDTEPTPETATEIKTSVSEETPAPETPSAPEETETAPPEVCPPKNDGWKTAAIIAGGALLALGAGVAAFLIVRRKRKG